MTSERTGHWTKMCRPFVPFNGSGTSCHTQSSVGFITATFGFRFSVHTPGLWASFHRAGQSHGYPRPANHSSVTMAKWHSGTFDRYVAPRVLGSNRDLWRGTFAADPFYLCGILQSSTPAHGITKGCAIAASCPHSIGGSSESGFAAVGPSGHTISPHPSSREGHHDSQEQKLRGPRCAAASIRSRHKAGRPCCCIWRTPSSRSSSIVRELLQSSSNALIAEQGCAGNPFHRNRWPHSGRANPGRIAP